MSQYPPYNYHQQTPGPPQPPWQQEPNRRSGWNDPRLQNAHLPAHVPSPPAPYQQSSFGPPVQHAPLPASHQHPPPPPPPPPPSGYNGTFGPPGLSQYDTASWGVRYHQSQQQSHQSQPLMQAQSAYPEQRPALPPRPTSSLAQTEPGVAPLNVWQQGTSSTQVTAQEPWGPSHTQSQPFQPPVPPPRPAAYVVHGQQNMSVMPHDQYSHHPSTHHYDPITQTQWNQDQNYPNAAPIAAESWNQVPQQPDGAVSPIDDESRRYSITGRSHTVSPLPRRNQYQAPPSRTSYPDPQVSATALGSGQPSDWQHYQSPNSYYTEPENVDPAQKVSRPDHGESFVSSPTPIHALTYGNSEHTTIGPNPASSPLQPGAMNPESYDSQSPRSESQLEQINSKQQDGNQYSIRSASREKSIPAAGSDIDRSGTIDSVINAWSAPLNTAGPDRPANVASEVPSGATSRYDPLTYTETETQTDFLPIVKTEIKAETKVVTKEVEVDPYKDIENEYRATLKRFAGMLRQEAAAETDEEKFKIFQGFVIREMRLRSVLYGVEAQASETPKKVPVSASLPMIGSSISLPAQMKQADVSPGVEETSQTQNAPELLQSVSDRSTSSPSAKDDSYVVVDASDGDVDYSPGGRPRVGLLRTKTPRLETPRVVSHIEAAHQATGLSQIDQMSSPGANAPMAMDDYLMPEQVSPSNDAPIVVGPDNLERTPATVPSLTNSLTGPLNFQPPRPVYTPFRYNESAAQEIPEVKIERPVDSYEELRQTQAAESGRMLTQDVIPIPKEFPSRGHNETPFGGRREHEEAFIGLIRQQSKVIRKKPATAVEPLPQLRAGTPLTKSTQGPAPTKPPLTKAVQSLRSCIPDTNGIRAPTGESSLQLRSITAKVDQTTDDFSFIHAAVLAWDQTNRRIRQTLEAERTVRQSENESRIDQLFHDNEIGYADIANLESGFKLDEAGKKYQEDKLELESFVSDVFDVVVNRMEGELVELGSTQTLARDLLDLHSGSAGRTVLLTLEGQGRDADSVYMVEVMEITVRIFNKLELRHQKIAEANFERERRRKRLELSVLYTNGDTSGVKKLERDFAKAEIIQILEETRKKNERANRLMDSFDRAVVRGLAENQGWQDDTLVKLQLLRDLMLGSDENGPQDDKDREELLYGDAGIRNLMSQAQRSIEYVLKDSQDLVKLSYLAEQLLNEADYSMYLAEERIAEADPKKLARLTQDKKKEDEKIREEFESRTSGIARCPNEGLALVREVVSKVGNDKEHQSRIDRALMEAKRRNQDLAASGP